MQQQMCSITEQQSVSDQDRLLGDAGAGECQSRGLHTHTWLLGDVHPASLKGSLSSPQTGGD